MIYVDVTVQDATTKEALKEAVNSDPSKVIVSSASEFGFQFNGPISRMDGGTMLVVTGPEHRWFANIQRTGNYKFVVV